MSVSCLHYCLEMPAILFGWFQEATPSNNIPSNNLIPHAHAQGVKQSVCMSVVVVVVVVVRTKIASLGVLGP